MNQESTVSICVLTYNAEKTIIETLESIKNQTYKNIELIVSDDNSSDKTIEIIKSWIENNQNRFTKCYVIESPQNTGVTANCNRACKIANGDYIKPIGDDILYENFVADCLEYFRENLNAKILFTRVRLLDTKTNMIVEDDQHNYDFFNLSSKDQFDNILKNVGLYIPSCSVIYKKSLLREMGYFDEEIPMWEDGPMYFRISEKGIKLEFLDKIEVLYRVNSNSLSHSYSPQNSKSGLISYKKYYFKYIKKTHWFTARLRLVWYSMLASESFLIQVLIKMIRHF